MTSFNLMKDHFDKNQKSHESKDLESRLNPKYSIDQLGYLIPVKCGHWASPKENEKEKWALDMLLQDAGFVTQLGCKWKDGTIIVVPTFATEEDEKTN